MRFNILLIVVLVVMMYIIPLHGFQKQNIARQKGQSMVVTAAPVVSEASSTAPVAPSEGKGTELPQVTRVEDLTLSEPFHILNTTTGQVETISQQEYVRGAVCAEMPPDFHTEALKAQAVSAHTYALYHKLMQKRNPDPQLKGADFEADPQNWKGYVTEDQAKERFGEHFDTYYGKIKTAADEVFPYVLLYDQQLIVAAYHSMSTGVTEDASHVWSNGAPYLVSVDSEGDLLAPNYQTTVTFSEASVKQRLQEALPEAVLPAGADRWMNVTERSDGGYVLKAKVGNQEVHGKVLRQIFDLRSASFTVEYKNKQFLFTVTGYGHGVGLSQYGADYMARQGKNYQEILGHYYQNTQLVQLPS